MKLALIVAAAKNGVIGINNQLPWHIPQDLKYFKAVTMNKPVIMGRKTYESIGRPLPGRLNIVVTRDHHWNAPEGVVVVNSIAEGINAAQQAVAQRADIDEAVVIGGAQIYREVLPQVDKIYLTEVDMAPAGDAYFPALSPSVWRLESSVSGDAEASIGHQFLVFERQLPVAI